jgi:predicted unusual protein kinase regulating ubiquinone biosynthesis (AarF/ABC1/UbiB family)
MIICVLYIYQDGLPTFPDEEAFECIERELGLSIDSIFSSISSSPIAAASLGQVYKAKLKKSGNVVAVKVQRPGIEEAIGLDFYLIRGLGFLVNKYVDRFTTDVVALIDEFAYRVFQELNYVQVSSFVKHRNLCFSTAICATVIHSGVLVFFERKKNSRGCRFYKLY